MYNMYICDICPCSHCIHGGVRKCGIPNSSAFFWTYNYTWNMRTRKPSKTSIFPHWSHLIPKPPAPVLWATSSDCIPAEPCWPRKSECPWEVSVSSEAWMDMRVLWILEDVPNSGGCSTLLRRYVKEAEAISVQNQSERKRWYILYIYIYVCVYVILEVESTRIEIL